MVAITQHAKQRLEERAGVKCSACDKVAERALEQGVSREETAGNLYKWLTHLYCSHENIADLRVFNYKVYVFDGGRLITVMDLPREYKNAFDKARKKKQESINTHDIERTVSPMAESGLVNLLNIQVADDMPVSGRELHEQLGVDTPYHIWFPRQCDGLFEEGRDYCTKLFNRSDGKPGKPLADHKLTIHMAKEMSLLQRTDKGREVRRYLIKVEEAWNSEDAVVARALQIQNRKILNLQAVNNELSMQIKALKPKADYVDWILQNPGLVTITQIAKDYGMSGQAMNDTLAKFRIQFKQSDQWLLYRKYHGMGYTHSETVPFTHRDGREDVKMVTKWTQKGRLFIYELLKEEIDLLPVIERPKSA